MKKIKDIMNAQPLSVTKSETLKNAANQMDKSNIGFLPVVDENQKVVGTITDRDITLAIGKKDKAPKEITVSEIMNSRIHTIKAEDDASTALEIMRTKQIGRLPVVDSENRLKGVVTLSTIANKIYNTSDQAELEHKGKENIMNTLRSLATRNKRETVEEPAAE